MTRRGWRSWGWGSAIPAASATGGDRPPRPECAPRWHARLRALFPAIELTLLVGRYAIDYYLPGAAQRSMTEVIVRWRDFLPELFVLPHPSWRTTRWLRDNPWFEAEALPELRARVSPGDQSDCLDPLHVVVAEAEMVADLVDQHMADHVREVLAASRTNNRGSAGGRGRSCRDRAADR